LVTALETVGDIRFPVSSSRKPDLMVRMLEILDVKGGHRVLEIGTGTGYNAALLAHRLGNKCVFSVDVGEDLVGLARGTARRRRLSTHAGGRRRRSRSSRARTVRSDHRDFFSTGRAVGMGRALATDGTILVDLKLANSAGNLVHLHRVDGRLEGHFTTRWAAFTAMRTGAAPEPVSRADRATGGRTRPTDAPATPWTEAKVAWFLAQLRLPPGTSFGYDLDPHQATGRDDLRRSQWLMCPA